MNMESIQKIKDAFRPMLGQMVWSVRRSHGTFLTMESGSPHLAVREPIASSTDVLPEVRRNLAKRRVSIVGDWHLWIKYAQWKIQTFNYSVTSQDTEFASIDRALNELDGQILSSADAGQMLYSCILRFDLGASIHICPPPEIDDDQWSLYEFNGSIISCKTNGDLFYENNLN